MDCIVIDDEDDDLEIIEEDPNIDIVDIAKACADKRFEVFEEDENNEARIIDLSSESNEHLSSNDHDDNAQANKEAVGSDIPLEPSETPVNREETPDGAKNDISSENVVVKVKEEPIEIKREIENLNEYFQQMNRNEEEEEDCVQVVHDNFRFEVLEEGPNNETHDLGTSTYFCEHCEFIATNNEQLLNHNSNVHSNTGKCHLCEKVLSSKRSLARHIKLVHCKRKESVECLYCRRKLKKKGCIYRHMKYRHQRYNKHLEEGIDFRFITRKTSEKVPEKNTSDINSPVECLHCDAVYVGKKYLNRHMKIEHKIFPPLKTGVDFKMVPWPQGTLSTRCLHCRYIFKTINDLKRHAESKHKNYHSLKQGVDFEYIQQSLIESAVDNSRASSPVEDSRCVENEKYSNILESVGLQKKADLESDLLESSHNSEIPAELTEPISKPEEPCMPKETLLESFNDGLVHLDSDTTRTLSPRREEHDNIPESVEPQKEEHVQLIPLKDNFDSEIVTESNEFVLQENEELSKETCLENPQVVIMDTYSQVITDLSPTKEAYEDNVREEDESNMDVEKLEEQTVSITSSQNEEHNETISDSMNTKDAVINLATNVEHRKNNSKPEKTTKHSKKKEKRKFETDCQIMTDFNPMKEEYEDNIREDINEDESKMDVEKLEEQTVTITSSQNEELNETVSDLANTKDAVINLPTNVEYKKNNSKPEKTTKHSKKKEKRKLDTDCQIITDFNPKHSKKKEKSKLDTDCQIITDFNPTKEEYEDNIREDINEDEFNMDVEKLEEQTVTITSLQNEELNETVSDSANTKDAVINLPTNVEHEKNNSKPEKTTKHSKKKEKRKLDTDCQIITDFNPTKEEYEDNIGEDINEDEFNMDVEKLEEQTVTITSSQNEEHNETVSDLANTKDAVIDLQTNVEHNKNDSKPEKTTKHSKKKEKRKFYCKYCAYKTVKYYNYLVHINRFDHEMRELYICPYCEKFTSYFRIEVKAHFREDHWDDHRSLRCPNCPFESKSYIRWIQHKKDHMKNIKKRDLLCYICTQCDYKTLFRTKLIKHTRIEHEKEDMLAKCVFCEYQGNINRLVKHLNSAHHRDCEIFNCSLCTHKADYLVKLEERCVENMDVSVICSFCDEEFPSQGDLDAHITSSHKDICQMFICFQCNLGTNNEKAFVKHLKAKHDDSDCFYCSCCNFKTNLKHHLADHLAFEHERSGKYIPVVESNLDGYRCEHCAFKSKRARCMMKHMEERHKYNLPGFYFCPRCGRKFKKLSGVERHLLKYHENSLSSSENRKFNGRSKAEGSVEGQGENSSLKSEKNKTCLVVKMTSNGEVTSTYIE